MGSIKQNHIKSLQSLRFIFILGIIFSHFGMKFSYAYFAVCGFLVLSGFVLTLRHYRGDTADLCKPLKFAVSRINNIYFTYMLTLLMLLPLTVYNIIHQALSFRAYLGTFFVDALLLQSWFPHIKLAASINDVSWFLSSIFFLYLIFPFILKLMKKINNDFLLIGLFVLSSAVSLIMLLIIKRLFFLSDDLYYFWLIYRFPIFRINDFLAGCIAAIFYEKYLRDIKINVYTGTLLEVLALLLIPLTTFVNRLCHSYAEIAFLSNPVSVFILPATFTVLIFSMEKGLLSRIMSLSFPVKCGNLSSDVFLIHYVFIYYIYLPRFNFLLDGFGKPTLITKILILACSYGIAVITRTMLAKFKQSLPSRSS